MLRIFFNTYSANFIASIHFAFMSSVFAKNENALVPSFFAIMKELFHYKRYQISNVYIPPYHTPMHSKCNQNTDWYWNKYHIKINVASQKKNKQWDLITIHNKIPTSLHPHAPLPLPPSWNYKKKDLPDGVSVCITLSVLRWVSRLVGCWSWTL